MQRRADADVIKALQAASRDIDARLKALRGSQNISAKVEAAQLQTAKASIHRILAELWTSMGRKIKARQAEAMAEALERGWQWDQILLTRAGLSPEQRAAMKKSLLQTADRNVEVAIRRINGDAAPLSRRVYKSQQLSTGWVDGKINSALARGLNWKQFAEEVKSSINPSTAGGVAYAAKRLARTEINAAYHAATVAQNRDKPWNTGMVWELSKSHPTPDICNLYADRSPYPLGEVPSKPHPHCLCYTYPETVSAEEFRSNLRSGRYDAYLFENYGVRDRQVG